MAAKSAEEAVEGNAILHVPGSYGSILYAQLETMSAQRLMQLPDDAIVYIDNNSHNHNPDNKITLGEYRRRLQNRYYESKFEFYLQ